jgi:hypothetical protein
LVSLLLQSVVGTMLVFMIDHPERLLLSRYVSQRARRERPAGHA